MTLNRGFVAIWYSGYGYNRTQPNPDTAAFWRGMVADVLRAWRAHHPHDRLMFLDLDDQFSALEWRHLCDMGIEPGKPWYCPQVLNKEWTRTYIDKARVLQLSPFDETCLFDLDMLFVANVSRVFDIVAPGAMGVLGYPFYKAMRNRINCGLWVVRDKSVWPAYWDAYEQTRGQHPGHDEHALDLAIDRRTIQVTKISPTYGMDPFCWLMRDGLRRQGRGWTDVSALHVPGDAKCGNPACLLEPWTMGDKVIRAIHMSGARQRIVGSPLWSLYRQAVTEELTARYGGVFPPEAA